MNKQESNLSFKDIYSDGVHLISAVSESHLHKYCRSIGIHFCWFHSSSKFKHYDIPKKKRFSFFKDHPEVIQVSTKEIVRILKKIT